MFNQKMTITSFCISLLLCFCLQTYCFSQTTKEIFPQEEIVQQKDQLAILLEYNKTIASKPNVSVTYVQRGKIRAQLKDYRGAIQDYNKAIFLNANFPIAYYHKAVAEYRLINYHGAIYNCNKMISIYPLFPNAYLYRGLAKLKLGEKEDGCSDLQRSLKLGSTEASQAFHNNCNK